MKNKTNLGGRSQSHQIDITEENLKRKCGGGYLDNVHWIFSEYYSHKVSCSGSCNVFVYDSVIPLNYWILVIKCIMMALRYNAPEAVVFHPALFFQF